MFDLIYTSESFKVKPGKTIFLSYLTKLKYNPYLSSKFKNGDK